VVLVDDQPDALYVLRLRLEAAGMECVSFSNGAAAIAYVQGHSADVVMLDVMMPEIDGYETCRRLKADPGTRDIPVIFVTAKFEMPDRLQGFEAGGHDVVAKPVQQLELVARVRAALRAKRAQDQLRDQIGLQQHLHELHRGMLSEHWQKTLGQLASSLAHELNNPLAAAVGNVQLLRLMAPLGQEVQERLTAVDVSLQRVTRQLRRLLLIAQPDRPRQRIDLAELLMDVGTLVNHELVMNKVSLRRRLAAECLWEGVACDLARVLLYVVNNAIEAVRGRSDATIAFALERNGARYWIDIADNGPGIAAEARPRMFEPFYTTKAPPHHGIGLFLAGEAAKALGARIEFESPGGEYATRFRISVPVNA
jgi:signal transduction histidine kinase